MKTKLGLRLILSTLIPFKDNSGNFESLENRFFNSWNEFWYVLGQGLYFTRDIWGNCPYFVLILDFLLKSKGYLLPCEKIRTVLLLKEISKICPYFVQILAVFCLSEQEICPDFWPFFGLSIWRIWNISTNLL